MSDANRVPLQFFLICGPSTLPAMKPQMRYLSLLLVQALSSYHTMPGGFLRLKPREWGVREGAAS